ncbi:hypothetical protein [Yoonia sp. SS1-5]|uniref:Uncharacterized protein n=1 Tax=Yoonia rhodophyticola TaxID=3137370 RepID=A0AAN0MAH3_9RHOB
MGWLAVFLMFIAVRAHLKRQVWQARAYLTGCFIFDGDLLTIALVHHAVVNGSRDLAQLAGWVIGFALFQHQRLDCAPG